MDVLISKVSSLFILAITTTAAGILPLKFRKSLSSSGKRRSDVGHSHKPHNGWLNAILAFSGGVLFSTIFIHLMPDVDAAFEKALDQTSDGLISFNQDGVTTPIVPSNKFLTKMPWGQFAICLGFFLIYALEETVEYFLCRSCEKDHHHHNDLQSVEYRNQQQSSVTPSNQYMAVTPTAKIVTSDKQASVPCLSPVHGTHGAHREQHQIKDCPSVRRLFPANNTSFDDVDLETANEKTPLFKFDEKPKTYHRDADQPTCSDLTPPPSRIFIPKIVEKDHPAHHSHSFEHNHQHSEKIDSTNEPQKYDDVRNTMRGVLLIVALSFHSIFEGMAIGLQSSISGIWTSFAAVAMHKLVMAFCAGVELLALGSKRSIFICSMFTFSLICPIGIAIGTIVTEAVDPGGSNQSSPSLAIASLQGLACGTLLYVTFFEVLTRTKGNEMASLVNFVSVLLGFSVITGLHLID
ncbi:hypothetical protein CHUAL_001499 [Chamberlinius hualienensis]